MADGYGIASGYHIHDLKKLLDLHTNHFPPGYPIQVADEYGLVPEDYIHDLKQLSDVRYIQVIVATSMVYDMIRIILKQVQHLHSRKWSKLHLIYFSVPICSWITMIMNLCGANISWASRSWCIFGRALVLEFITILTLLVVNILLVLRLRAIWNKNFIVILILYFIMAVEVLVAMSVIIADTYFNSVSGLLLPLHGCWDTATHLDNIQSSLASAFYVIRATTAAIEFLLTFIRFIMTYRTQRVFGGGIRDGISHMQTSTRLLYVFYRDGILLAIPLLVCSIVEAAYAFNPSSDETVFNILSYSSCFIYPFIVSRLILNLLPANCPLDESICSKTMESLRFYHSELNSDTEADVSQMTEELYVEET